MHIHGMIVMSIKFTTTVLLLFSYNKSLLKVLVAKFSVVFLVLNIAVLSIGQAIMEIHNFPASTLMAIINAVMLIVCCSGLIFIDAAPRIIMGPRRKVFLFVGYSTLIGW